MKHSVKKGASFGLTSGIITTLGLIIGLHSSTHSRIVVTGGILVIAIADAMSDSLGMHLSEESGNKNKKHIWEATATTFIAKFIFALTFLVPIMLFELSTAIIVSIVWGLLLISLLSFFIAKEREEPVWKAILEHVLIMIIVILITHYVGDFVGALG